MKTSIKITLLVIIAIIVIAASRSGEPPQREKKVNPVKGCYSQEEVRLLMDVNGWSRQEAVQALELSCEYPVTPK